MLYEQRWQRVSFLHCSCPSKTTCYFKIRMQIQSRLCSALIHCMQELIPLMSLAKLSSDRPKWRWNPAPRKGLMVLALPLNRWPTFISGSWNKSGPGLCCVGLRIAQDSAAQVWFCICGNKMVYTIRLHAGPAQGGQTDFSCECSLSAFVSASLLRLPHTSPQ